MNNARVSLNLGWVTRVLLIAASTGLLESGCSSDEHEQLPPASLASESPQVLKLPFNPNDETDRYAREFPDQAPLIKSGKDFTMVPPESYTPLPPTNLLGATTLREREDICEVIIRHLATKPERGIKYRFIGFQGNAGTEHDPNKQLLQRLRNLQLAMQPVSEAKESRIVNGMRVDSEQAEHGMKYFIVYIHVDDGDKDGDLAEVGVNEMWGFLHGGQRFTYTLTRSNGQWRITMEEGGPIF